MATLTLTVAASADDATINDLGYDDAATEILWGGTGTTNANRGQGARFTNVTLASTATINSASLSLMKSAANWTTVNWRLVAVAEDNTATFSTGSPPGSRAIAASIAAENLNVNHPIDTRFSFPSTTPLRTTLGASIAAVIARAGWASGNALAIVNNSHQDASASASFGRENFHSWDSATAASEPQLVIDYTPGSGGVAHALAGATNGTSTGAATALRLNHAVNAATNGTSAAGATAIRLTHALAATTNGTSAISASSLTQTHALTGSADGTSTATANALVLAHALTASATGTSAVTASVLRLTHALTATTNGASSATADLTTSPASGLQATVSGTSSAAAAGLRLTHPLAAVATGTSSAAAGGITFVHALAASTSGVSSASAGAITLAHALGASATGTSAASATGVRVTSVLAALASGTSGATATLSIGGLEPQRPLTPPTRAAAPRQPARPRFQPRRR